MEQKAYSKTSYKSATASTINKNYLYLTFGLLFLLALAAAFAIYSRKSGPSISKKLPGAKIENVGTSKKYTVKQGDDLWMIAEQHYGSGFNAYDIARENKITRPDYITAGQVLVIPSIQPKTPTKGEVLAATTAKKELKANTKYTIKQGDNLWNIAVEYYGDGFLWKKIADANNLTNPSVIHAGNAITIPRT